METLVRNKANSVTASITIDIISYAFVILFLHASLYKLFDYGLFQKQLEKSPLIGAYYEVFAWMVPTVEIVIALMLLSKNWKFKAMYGATVVMFLFTLYVGYVLLAAPHIPCSCGGVIAGMGWKAHLVFNAGFTLLGALGIILLMKKT